MSVSRVIAFKWYHVLNMKKDIYYINLIKKMFNVFIKNNFQGKYLL